MFRVLQKYPFAKFKSNSRQEMYSKRAHSHREVSLGFIESGETTITVKNQQYKLIPGDIVLIPSETVHLCIPHNIELFKFKMIYFDSSWWNNHFDIRHDSFKTLAIPGPEAVKAFIKNIIKGSLDSSLMEQNTIKALTELVVKYKLSCERIDSSEREIDRIHQQIKEMPQISSSIEEMAEQLGLSKFSFIRRYAQRYGLTPHADVVNMRIQRAILLFESEMDLISIALECGFADQSHFINQFKLYTGLRPQEYRSSLAKG